VEADLRILFFIDGDLVYTVDIGSHAIYRWNFEVHRAQIDFGQIRTLELRISARIRRTCQSAALPDSRNV